MSSDFANVWGDCIERIQYIRSEWDIWNVKTANNNEPTVTGYDLLPPWEQTKLVCMTCAEGNFATYRELYFKMDYADVWEVLGLQKAFHYVPPRK